MTENVSSNRANISDGDIHDWFNEVGEYLKSKKLDKIDASRIFNCDETGISLNPKSSSVFVEKGTKNVYRVVGNNEKENVTVLFTGNAAGKLAPPLALFAGQQMPAKAQDCLPEGWSAGYSDSGWMTSKNFYEYVTNVFHPWLIAEEIQLPVVLYMDGHASHITLPLSEFCSANGIELIALPPNSTHILQPFDVAYFIPLKHWWQQICMEFCRKHLQLSVKKYQLAKVLKCTLDSMEGNKNLPNGFEICGLCPLNANAIDYTKFLKKTTTQSCPTEENVLVSRTQGDVSALS